MVNSRDAQVGLVLVRIKITKLSVRRVKCLRLGILPVAGTVAAVAVLWGVSPESNAMMLWGFALGYSVYVMYGAWECSFQTRVSSSI